VTEDKQQQTLSHKNR